jgi:hypothetical protein
MVNLVRRADPQPPSEDYPRILSAVVEAIADGNTEGAAEHLKPIAYPPRGRSGAQPDHPGARCVDLARGLLLLSLLRRPNHSRLRYALRRCAVPRGVSVPQELAWRTHAPGHSRDRVDRRHIVPGSRGGAWLSPENLVTTCPRCNAIKADYTLEQLGWQLLEVSSPQWDGLTAYFPALWEAAGRPDDQRVSLRLIPPTRSEPPHPPP